MTNYLFTRIFYLLLFALAALQTEASEGKPITTVTLAVSPSYVVADTIPPVKQTAEEKPVEQKPVTIPATTTAPLIKVVPKARKQIKPVALPTVPIKTPKVIKPIIKVGSLLP
ncbi:hypothetical protein LZZ85_20435 [Terrimonas sp. NA20]|uniref:Uncharacterized protein n=1 Tax=Terrimonas ginsenosidimutans TaxID=2908004 RepID=A0ABS9KWL4_9BACT|nr:hypothetical protein [Terrimonas ginsenosidimutans]MCG2616678.1 hypothetical protein [Terrimonas ginsenosidimutans]